MASTISLGFFTMHARCWPFTTDDKNLLKLASEMVLMLVFLSTAVLRSALTKLDLVDAGLLRADDLTSEEREMPGNLAVFMVVVTCSIPITILVYNHCVYNRHGTPMPLSTKSVVEWLGELGVEDLDDKVRAPPLRCA